MKMRLTIGLAAGALVAAMLPAVATAAAPTALGLFQCGSDKGVFGPARVGEVVRGVMQVYVHCEADIASATVAITRPDGTARVIIRRD